jgi:uncharacterized protein
MRMSRSWAALILVVGLAGAGWAEPDPAAERALLEAGAKGLVELLAKDDFAAAARTLDPDNRPGWTADKLKTVWKDTVASAGAFKSIAGSRAEIPFLQEDSATLTCNFEKAVLYVRVAFNGDKKVKDLTFTRAPAYVKPGAFVERPVTVGEKEWALPGTLTLPVGDGPFPAVVLVHGSGPGDRDETIGPNKPFRDLAGGLASRGIAVLRYEKRTKEHGVKMVSEKVPITIKEEALDDAVAAAALLRKTREIDPKRVFVVGHSLGAYLAPKIGEMDPSVAGLIMLAGPARSLEDVIVEQFTYIWSLDGPLSEEHKAQLEKMKAQVARVKDPKLSPETPTSELPLGGPAVYWLSLRAYHATETANRIKQPLLLLQGERDYQVTPSELELWKKALAGRKEVEYRSYAKLNHLFIEGEGKSRPQEYAKAGAVAAEVVEDIAAWIQKR